MQGCIAIVRHSLPPDVEAACSFTDKAKRCVEAGAVAIVVVNSENSPPLALHRQGRLPVPVVCIAEADGDARECLPPFGTGLRDAVHAAMRLVAACASASLPWSLCSGHVTQT